MFRFPAMSRIQCHPVFLALTVFLTSFLFFLISFILFYFFPDNFLLHYKDYQPKFSLPPLLPLPFHSPTHPPSKYLCIFWHLFYSDSWAPGGDMVHLLQLECSIISKFLLLYFKCMYTWHPAPVWKLENNLWELVLSYHVLFWRLI